MLRRRPPRRLVVAPWCDGGCCSCGGGCQGGCQGGCRGGAAPERATAAWRSRCAATSSRAAASPTSARAGDGVSGLAGCRSSPARQACAPGAEGVVRQAATAHARQPPWLAFKARAAAPSSGAVSKRHEQEPRQSSGRVHGSARLPSAPRLVARRRRRCGALGCHTGSTRNKIGAQGASALDTARFGPDANC